MKNGTPTGTVVKSPARQKRDRARRLREEAAWAARSGPVEVRFENPADLRKSLSGGDGTLKESEQDSAKHPSP